MGMKRSHTVKALFRRFALSLVVLLGVAILVPILLQTTAVNMGIATRANQSELQVREIVPTLTVAPDVTKVVLPQGCRYLILDKDFNELYSNMAADEKEDALSYAKGEYILILNPDIILLKDSIDTLYQYLQTHQEVGIVAPQLLNTDLSVQHSARTFISPRILMARIFTKGKDDSTNQHVKQYLMTELSQTDPSEVDWCMGAALLLRNPFYKQLKGFDEGFFLYVEDMDICHRCWNLGKKSLYSDDEQYGSLEASSFSWNVGVGVNALKVLQVGVTYNIALGKTGEVENLYDAATTAKLKNNTWQVRLACMF